MTDPQAAWVARKDTDPFFAYDANYLIDNKAGIIVDAEGTRANRVAEIAITGTMIERVRDRFDLQPRRLAGDTAYGAVRLLKWLVDRQICRTSRSGISRRAPMGLSAGPTLSSTDRAMSTSARVESCCTPPEQLSRAARIAIVPQNAIAMPARSKCGAAPTCPCGRFLATFRGRPRCRSRTGQNLGFEQSRRERKKVEMRFAHMKRIFKLDRLRLRGLSGARDEVLLTATAQNLRRLVKFLCRPPPLAPITCAA